MIGKVSPEMQRLVQVARECLEVGLQAARPWGFGDIGAAVQEHAEGNGYSVVREFGGHGVGLKFHEDPLSAMSDAAVPVFCWYREWYLLSNR